MKVMKMKRRLSLLMILAVFLSFTMATTIEVNAASKPDLKKANVKWDLKNNKKLTYKQYWYSMGVKKHTVKMTKFKVKNASKPGYKQCTFTVTFNINVKPSKKQITKMGIRAGDGKDYTNWGVCVVDYKTGMSLEVENDKDVTSTCKTKHYKQTKLKGIDGAWIRYPKKTVMKVKIIYPKDYKDLAIGVVGSSNAKISSAAKFWDGKIPFSKAKSLYSKKDKGFAHFMRVK